MGDVFGKPAIVTDTHCIRLVNRMGLVDNIKEPKKVEMALWKLIPPEEGSDFCHRLVYHGRDVCTARTKPHCERCCLSDICAKNGVITEEITEQETAGSVKNRYKGLGKTGKEKKRKQKKQSGRMKLETANSDIEKG